MRLKLNDEKLTAYVLGELDAAEREAVENALKGNEAAQRAVAELRGVAKLAEAVFECQPVDALTEAQRAAIISRAKEAQQGEAQAVPGTFSKRPKAAPRRWIWTTVRVAAVITVVGAIAAALGVPNLLRSRMQSSDRHAGWPTGRVTRGIVGPGAIYAVRIGSREPVEVTAMSVEASRSIHWLKGTTSTSI